MTAVTFTDGEIASAAKFNAIAVAADNAQTAADAMATSATAAQTAATAAANSQSVATANATAAQASASLAGAQLSGAMANVGRNYIDNPLFTVAQRGAGNFSTAGYTLDRWRAAGVHSNGVMTVAQNPHTDASRAAIGDEEATSLITYAFTGGTGADDIDALQQYVENVRRLAGKTVTVSFWAGASAGTPKVGISLSQVFGTGGSPSGVVSGIGSTAVTISTTWTRYTATIAVPTASGRTFGTNGDSYTSLNLWLSSGTTNNTAAGNIGVQSGSVSFWGVQLEAASAVTPLEKRDAQREISRCQRFFQTGGMNLSGYAVGGIAVTQTRPFAVLMRATPTMLFTGANTNVNTPVMTSTPDRLALSGTVAATGQFVLAASLWTASADL